ncbi:hypothetical protein SAMN05216266_11087 [Amycolatopsis marina]|uniref:Uncharacterized protein n=1 Tax=Amycolatopsis marina TaxID=490629 RepID=A0A1I1AR78_9PSEU|nr:hypothetical protein [Amycolatopsis marina]SFB40555.1 hypothetical protein SAMN05216266_11087 [Amycolatopsis marina]
MNSPGRGQPPAGQQPWSEGATPGRIGQVLSAPAAQQETQPVLAPAPAAPPAEQESKPQAEQNPEKQRAATPAAIGEVRARPEQTALASAAPLPPVPGPGDGGEPPRPEHEPEAWRSRRHRRLSRLRIGRHLAPAAALDQLQLTATSFGVALGRDQSGAPVPVTLFRPRPVRAVVLGDLWAAQLVAFRALGFGARVVVLTARPAQWQHLGQWATGRGDRVAVVEPGTPVDSVASPDAPVLRVADLAPGQQPQSADLSGWQTELSVIRGLAPDTMALVHEADLLLAQRLAAQEVATLAAWRGLEQHACHAVQMLHDDMLAVLSGTEVGYVWTDPTSTEISALGRPGRH